ncbi:MAG: glycosyltransferase family 2 protein [Herpetosiphon sp.]
MRTSVSPASVIVLDNASGDGSVARIAGAFPEVVLLPLEQNLGFAAAVNIGIRYAVEQGADAICLLNNDAVLADDALGQLWGALNASPDNGIVSAKVFLHREPLHFWAVGGHFTNRRVINLGAGEFDNGQYDGMALDFVYLCAALIRVELLSIIGDLDEQFFLYYEDIDLSLRARAAGYRVLVAPDAHAWHDGSLSTRDRPNLKLFYEARSRLRFFHKHLDPGQRLLFYAAELRFVVMRSIRWLWAGQVLATLAYIEGCRRAFRRSPRPPHWLGD